MKVNFHSEFVVIPTNGVISTLVGSANSKVDEHTQNITIGKEVFTC